MAFCFRRAAFDIGSLSPRSLILLLSQYADPLVFHLCICLWSHGANWIVEFTVVQNNYFILSFAQGPALKDSKET